MRLDRTKAGAAAFIVAQLPRRLYLAEYSGVVVAQHDANSFDFQPDDPRIPGVSGVPLRLPAPGFTITINPALRPRALLAWADGDPTKPEIRLWETPGLAELVVQASAKLSLVAAAVNLGGDPALHPLLLGDVYRSAEDALFTAIGVFATAVGTALPPTAPAALTLNGAITAFQAAAATYLSTVVKGN